MFVSLPKVFEAMGIAGKIVGPVFFVMVLFAALTSSVSIMETLVASCMEKFNKSRKQVSLIITIIYLFLATIICLGYNVFYFEVDLPNGAMDQQLLDVCRNVLNDILTRKMTVTGGIGANIQGEAFGKAYMLTNDRNYTRPAPQFL